MALVGIESGMEGLTGEKVEERRDLWRLARAGPCMMNELQDFLFRKEMNGNLQEFYHHRHHL